MVPIGIVSVAEQCKQGWCRWRKERKYQLVRSGTKMMSEKLQDSTKRPKRKCQQTSFKSMLTKNRKAKEKESLVRAILKKDLAERTAEEKRIITRNKRVVGILEKRAQLRELNRQKSLEVEDSAEDLEYKAAELAHIISTAEHLVVYTGAGISTAASIPDYRGPNGVWTLLQQGKESSLQNHSLVDAEPTTTHMALAKLMKEDKVKHIVSQNCDGLHLRSGIPADSLSELHGNMYIEVCTKCDPEKQYVRLFDVTELTALRRHKTSRRCHACGDLLRDTIVHFGEKGVVDRPLNWAGAVDAAEDADVILCLGSSLKVLRRYQCLWNTDRPKSQRPTLCIINLQWTPKDSQAALKIHGKCDDVMLLVMKHLELQIPRYIRSSDPIFKMATPLREDEVNSHSTKSLSPQRDLIKLKDEQIKTETGEQCLAIDGLNPSVTNPSGADQSVVRDEDYKNEDKAFIDEAPSHEGGVVEEVVMPGWFGKGCRKKVPKRVGRKKRRSRMLSEEMGT